MWDSLVKTPVGPSAVGFLPLKDLSNLDAKNLRYAECGLEGRGVFVLLDGGHGLTGHADLVSQLLLGHFAVIEAQAANGVGDRRGACHQAYRRNWTMTIISRKTLATAIAKKIKFAKINAAAAAGSPG